MENIGKAVDDVQAAWCLTLNYDNFTTGDNISRIPGSVKKWKEPGNKCMCNKEVKMTIVDFQQQSPQRLIVRYEHMNSQNEWWMMRLKAI